MFTENADIMLDMAANIRANLSVWTRPQVSARKPTACELNTTPRKPADAKIPCSAKVDSKSHFNEGMIMLTPIISTMTDMKQMPHTNIKK